MATVAVFKTLFDEFKQENKCPTEEIVKKKYYFPVNRLKVKFFKCLLQIRFNLIIFLENLLFYAWNHQCTMVSISTNVD